MCTSPTILSNSTILFRRVWPLRINPPLLVWGSWRLPLPFDGTGARHEMKWGRHRGLASMCRVCIAVRHVAAAFPEAGGSVTRTQRLL